MYILTNEKYEDGSPVLRRYWGVTYRAEKRALKKCFANMDVDPEAAEAYNEAAGRVAECAGEGLPSPIEKVENAFYLATVFVQEKARYLGKTATAKSAARLYDAALFHLWGFWKNPQPRFNFFNYETDVPHNLPKIFPRLLEVKQRIYWELKGKGLDPLALDFNFVECNPWLLKPIPSNP